MLLLCHSNSDVGLLGLGSGCGRLLELCKANILYGSEV